MKIANIHHEVDAILQNNTIYIYNWDAIVSPKSFVFVRSFKGLREKVIRQNSRNISKNLFGEKLNLILILQQQTLTAY